MTLVAPSILSADFAALGPAVEKLEGWGADLVHFDVMDGMYVPPITFGAGMLKALRPHTRLPFDAHLMVEKPEDKALDFVEAGASIVTFHPTTAKHPHRLLEDIKKAGAKAGIVINASVTPETAQYLLPVCDIVLLMSVNPGYGGQKFMPDMLKKAARLREMRMELNLDFLIEMDGGIYKENAKDAVQAGVDILVSGSGVFGEKDPRAAIAAMKGEQGGDIE